MFSYSQYRPSHLLFSVAAYDRPRNGQKCTHGRTPYHPDSATHADIFNLVQPTLRHVHDEFCAGCIFGLFDCPLALDGGFIGIL